MKAVVFGRKSGMSKLVAQFPDNGDAIWEELSWSCFSCFAR